MSYSIYDMPEMGLCATCGEFDTLELLDGDRLCIRCRRIRLQEKMEEPMKYQRPWSDDPSRRVGNLDENVKRSRMWPMMVTLLCAFVAMGYFAFAEAAHAGGCGFKPFKPFIPMGCRDMVATCVCDSRGQNCRWQWHCVR